MALIETDATQAASAVRYSRAQLLLVAVMLVAFGAAALLWWRFGEAVYASGLMTAFLACF
jgi:hypothetical protein